MTQNNMMKVGLKGAKKVSKYLKEHRLKAARAMNVSVKKETYRLSRLLKAELKAGQPGGRRFSPLSHMARYAGSRRGYRTSPLRRLQYGVRYEFRGGNGVTPLSARLGFIGGPDPAHGLLKNMAEAHQKGFTQEISEDQRSFMIQRGARLMGWRKGKKGTSYSSAYGRNQEATELSGERPFFLKKTTRSFKSPRRRIMTPFRLAHLAEANKNISKNFRRKMAGKRI